MSVVVRKPTKQRPTRRVPVFQLERKFADLARHLQLGNNKSALAIGLGIPVRTMADATRDEGCTPYLHAKLEKALAEKKKLTFSPGWVEWIDPQAHDDTPEEFRSDTAQHFIDRFVKENAPVSQATATIQLTQATGTAKRSPAHADSDEDARGLERFIEELDVRDIKTILVFATTGTATVRALRQSLERLSSRDPEAVFSVQILLSSAYISDGGRAAGIDQTRIELAQFANDRPNLEIDVRTYASVAAFRAAIIEHREDRSYSARLGYYHWGEDRRSKADSHNVLLDHVKADEPLLRVYLSWFRHFWGSHRVNTLIFDFDDTLFATTDAQVGGWVCAAEWAAKDRIASLKPSVLKSKRVDREAILKIILDKQNEEAILAQIFQGHLSAGTKDAIRATRFKERERLTEQDAVPIRHVLNDIDELRREYRVIIVSATSEHLIRQVFKKHKVRPFSYLFGRNARQIGREWRDVETKAQLFIRLSSMLGIPLERMIFVGDSDGDYRAATQLGMSFIENTYNANLHKCDTLIKKSEGQHERISGRVSGELKASVARIEQQLHERWERI